MEIRLLDLGSPITTHQPSSRFCRIDKTLPVSVKTTKQAHKGSSHSVWSTMAPNGEM